MKKLWLWLVIASSLAPLPAQADGNCPFSGFRGSYHKATYKVEHRNLANVVAWRINLQGESCVKDGKITFVRWNKWHYVNPDLKNWWEFDPGWTDTVTGGGVGQNHVYRRVHAGLKLCFIADFGVNCPKKAFPWVMVTMNTTPPYFAEAGGDKGMG